MEEKNKYRTLLSLLIIFIVTCLVQGVLLLKNSDFSFPWNNEKERNFNTFSQSLLDDYQNNQKDYWGRFDRFFDDDFFRGRDDPFQEMERMQRRMQEMIDKDFKRPFSDSWNSWFSRRFHKNGDDINIQTREESNNYVITISIPHLKENNFNVTVDYNGIHIEAEIEQLVEKKDTDGNIITKSKLHRKLNQTFPIPHNADYAKAQMEYKKNRVIIAIPKL